MSLKIKRDCIFFNGSRHVWNTLVLYGIHTGKVTSIHGCGTGLMEGQTQTPQSVYLWRLCNVACTTPYQHLNT